MTKWQWILKQFSRKLWLRASLFCLLGIISAMAAIMFRAYVPDDISELVGARAVDRILEIIASSMLAVTTFSLSTMVAAYTAATSNATPRSTKLLLEDNTTQNALSTFIGTFLYSLVCIIALSMGIYGENGRTILLFVTILVIIIMIGVLLRWINYLSQLGRVGKTIDMVEHAARLAIDERIKHPYLDGTPLRDYKPDDSHHPIYHEQIGYIQHVDMQALSELTEKYDVDFYIHALPGVFNDGCTPILYTSKQVEDKVIKTICYLFTVGGERSFDQDPRFGMIVLSEIATRALSPGVNDPGTAIDVIGTTVRVLSNWVRKEDKDPEPLYPHVHVPPIKTADIFDDVFTPIQRDGAALIEVGIRLQKALNSIARMGNDEAKKEAERHSKIALMYAEEALMLEEEKERLKANAAK